MITRSLKLLWNRRLFAIFASLMITRKLKITMEPQTFCYFCFPDDHQKV